MIVESTKWQWHQSTRREQSELDLRQTQSVDEWQIETQACHKNCLRIGLKVVCSQNKLASSVDAIAISEI